MGRKLKRTQTRGKRKQRNIQKAAAVLSKKYNILVSDAKVWLQEGVPLEVSQDPAFGKVRPKLLRP